MEQANLSATEVATISKALHGRAVERGPQLLGSQLGVIINQAVHPKTVRTYGGLRALVDADLKHLVRFVGPDENSTDLVFAVDATPGAPLLPEQLVEPVEVAGADLWRSFSNPKLTNRLACSPGGVLMALPVGQTISDGFTEILRPTADDYRELARTFVASLGDQPMAATLRAAVDHADFYSAFISELRRLRTPEFNLLREWETRRTAYVAGRLESELLRLGIDGSAAARIIELAKPQVRSPVRWPAAFQRTRSPDLSPQAQQLRGGPQDQLRKYLHEAIDQMSDSELRDLRLPLGAAFEAALRVRR